MAAGERLTIEAELRLLSPMHVGSGLQELTDGQAEIATVLLDHNGKPYLPGTTVKGVCRRLLEDSGEFDETAILKLFGEIKDSGSGAPGELTAFAMHCESTGTVESRLETDLLEPASGTYVSARNSIDRASGTAADHKLFQKRMVARGAKFKLRMSLKGNHSAPDVNDVCLRALVMFLRALQREEGVAFGSGRNDGQGRMQLVSKGVSTATATVIRDGRVEEPDMSDAINKLIGQYAAPQTARTSWILELSAEVLFAVLGRTDKKPERQERERGAGDNILKALRHNETTPDLPGTSLSGAMRSSAEWFLALSRMRDGGAYPDMVDAGDAPSDPVSRLFGETADEIRQAARHGAKRTGWAGLLRIARISQIGSTDKRQLMSVKLDRVTSAPIDGALFGTEGFVAPTFRVTLELDRRATDPDEAFANAWLSHLSTSRFGGLMLGHGSNRGQGWFSVKHKENGEGAAHG